MKGQDDHIVCYDSVFVFKDGVILEYKKNNIYIKFDDCAKNFAAENGIESCKCVATRDITTLTFTFYTQPKTKIIFKKFSWKNLITGRTAVGRFFDLEKRISQVGYTSYDLS